MSSHKRKRSVSHTSHGSSQPSSPSFPSSPILNPHAYSENTLKQLHAAGLTDAALLPSTYTPHFPHRPLASQHHHHHPPSDDDDDDEAHEDRRRRRAHAMRAAQDTQLAPLAAALRRALGRGDVARARRAFGLVRRSAVRGRAVDLRRGGLWALGAEVLMREGERPGGEGGGAAAGEDAGGEDESPPPPPRRRWRRWGATANLPAVRTFLEGLARQHPYHRLRPRAVSEVQFYPALFGCEVYDAWAEHRLGLERLEEEGEGEDEDEEREDEAAAAAWTGDDVETPDDDLSPRERRGRQARADLALRALGLMHDVAARMDALLAEVPHRSSAEMWRLRGMVALYMADLGIPPAPRTEDEEEEGVRTRDKERERAGRFFQKMRANGGRVDAFTEKWLQAVGGDHDDENDGSGPDEDGDQSMESAWSGLPVFSSLPTR